MSTGWIIFIVICLIFMGMFLLIAGIHAKLRKPDKECLHKNTSITPILTIRKEKAINTNIREEAIKRGREERMIPQISGWDIKKACDDCGKILN